MIAPSASLVPQKRISEKAEKALKIIFAVVGAVAVSSGAAGFYLLTEESRTCVTAGKVLICVCFLHLFIIIAANLVRAVKK